MAFVEPENSRVDTREQTTLPATVARVHTAQKRLACGKPHRVYKDPSCLSSASHSAATTQHFLLAIETPASASTLYIYSQHTLYTWSIPSSILLPEDISPTQTTWQPLEHPVHHLHHHHLRAAPRERNHAQSPITKAMGKSVTPKMGLPGPRTARPKLASVSSVERWSSAGA